MNNRILELEAELSSAIKIIDDGDRYSNNLEYIDSPYCAVVREFLFKHGVTSEAERPKLKLESINEIKNENDQLQQDKAELVELLSRLDAIKNLWVPVYALTDEHEAEVSVVQSAHEEIVKLMEKHK